MLPIQPHKGIEMKRIFLTLIVLVSLAGASRLSDLMAQYKRAPERQRFRIMNQIKLEIARLNKSRQHAAIRQLRRVNNSIQRRTDRIRKNHRIQRHRTQRHHAPTRHRPSPQEILDGRTKQTSRSTDSNAMHATHGGDSEHGGGSTPGGGSDHGGDSHHGGGSMRGGF